MKRKHLHIIKIDKKFEDNDTLFQWICKNFVFLKIRRTMRIGTDCENNTFGFDGQETLFGKVFFVYIDILEDKSEFFFNLMNNSNYDFSVFITNKLSLLDKILFYLKYKKLTTFTDIVLIETEFDF